MGKKVKFTEVTHQWEGTAIVRDSSGLREVNLGVIGSDKKLKEVGAKELFTKLPEGTITVEVKKLDDVSITYVCEVEDFKKIAKVEVITEETPNQEQAEGEAVGQ
jgi:hypothetical protein